MKEHRDIYESRENGDSPKGPPQSVDPGLGELKRRAWLTTAVLAVFMLLLLSGAVWLIREQEKKLRREEVPAGSDATTMPPVPLPVASDLGQAAPAQPAIPESALPDVLEPPSPPTAGAGAPALTAEQSAQAMTELRAAQDYLKARDLDRAEEHTKRALEIWPEWNSALRLLGLVYTQRGQFEQAITILEQAVAQNPLSVEGVNSLATAYMQKGWMGRAEELLQKAEVMNPEYWPAHLNLGLLYLLKKQYGTAADYLESAIEYVPNDVGPRNNLGVALMRLGRFEEARRHFQTIIEQRAATPAPYFNIAISFVLERDFEKAMEWIRRGAEHCTPMTAQNWLADDAFNPLRNYAPFQAIMSSFSPALPAPPVP
ncbi:MAG: tetratricopeptide repeat protein [Verrucomicrobia bacterium]|nr:tetratricopeptide repeat protein [Verrucomicrobiota bacterium]MBU1908438.1 tetratricopeptide repeat protein [Verrucomicrobiota bacterium]